MYAKFKLNAIIYSSDQDYSTQQKNIEADNADNTLPSIENKCVEQSIARHQWISEAAYFKAEARAFKAGRELNDWLEAEKDYIEMLITDYLSVCKEDGGMTKVSLQQLAKAIGVESPEKITQTIELVRVIQKASQQSSCFQSNHSKSCENKDCIWKAECQKLIAEWMR
jgi:hypothetical protein